MILRVSIHPWEASLIAQTVNNLPAIWETWVGCLGQEDPLEKGMTTNSSILAWRIPRTAEPVRATVHEVIKSWIWLRDFHCSITWKPSPPTSSWTWSTLLKVSSCLQAWAFWDPERQTDLLTDFIWWRVSMLAGLANQLPQISPLLSIHLLFFCLFSFLLSLFLAFFALINLRSFYLLKF